ncbi:deoxyribonuclease IV [Gorillibacterium timonense]|uniref:deoxyribonuclease IV n=1 Tax=Gorillibacterium timonense TaxID=1689269 RepID=UPI00071E1C38|nr:deoxyribonuclease IV [Gorillibacterium timonense]
MLKIGSHVSTADKGLLCAAEEAVSYGSSTFMLYTGAPQNTRRKAIEDFYVPEGKKVMEENGLTDIVVHAPYIINLGSYKDGTYQLAVDFLQTEIRRTHYMGVRNIVLHPGAFTEKDPEYGLKRIAEGLNEVLSGIRETDVNIALETMAGKGSELGRTFEELAIIMDNVELNDRLSVCLDTCHTHDSGYDIVGDLDGVLEQFDRTVGIGRLAVVHINDSKNPRGAAKDRHAPIGAGYLGFKTIQRVVQHEQLKHLPFILETPWIGKTDKSSSPMYEAEMALLRGNAEERLGVGYVEDVAKLTRFFAGREIDRRNFIDSTWELLRTDPKAKKADKREPMERLYDIVVEEGVFPELGEKDINMRLIGFFAGTDALPLT